jgi:hypothetical protein
VKIKSLFLVVLIGISGAGTGCAGLTGAQSSLPHNDVYSFLMPKLPISQPFAMDKAGNKARIDFWAVPGEVKLGDEGNGYMVAIKFSQRDTRENILDIIQRSETFQDDRKPIALKVRVFLLKNLIEVPIFASDYSSARAALGDPYYRTPTREKIEQSLAYLSPNSGDGNSELAVVVGFRLPEYGRYRVEVETVQNQPIFKEVGTALIIDKYLYSGK